MTQAKPAEPVPLLVVIAYWEGDKNLARKLVNLIVGMQAVHAKREVEIMLVCRQDCKIDKEMVAKLATRFNVHTHVSTSPFKGWPQGPNGMFASSMIHISQWMKPYGGVFWMEADCVPMRPSWYTELSNNWKRRKASTRIMGWIGDCHGDGTGVHITGCAIYECKIAKILPCITASCTAPWDFEHRKAMVSVGERTPLIENAYRARNATEATAALPFAVIHGFRDESLLDLVSKKYLT